MMNEFEAYGDEKPQLNEIAGEIMLGVSVLLLTLILGVLGGCALGLFAAFGLSGGRK